MEMERTTESMLAWTKVMMFLRTTSDIVSDKSCDCTSSFSSRSPALLLALFVLALLLSWMTKLITASQINQSQYTWAQWEIWGRRGYRKCTTYRPQASRNVVRRDYRMRIRVIAMPRLWGLLVGSVLWSMRRSFVWVLSYNWSVALLERMESLFSFISDTDLSSLLFLS